MATKSNPDVEKTSAQPGTRSRRPSNTDLEPFPYWIPDGVEIDDWPAEVRNDAISIINESYRDLVMQAPTGLARSTGLTIVHLMWQEVVDHVEMGRATPDREFRAVDFDFAAVVSGRESRAQRIERHMRLVTAKLKASEFFLRLQKFAASHSDRKSPTNFQSRNLPITPRRSQHYGKNDFC